MQELHSQYSHSSSKSTKMAMLGIQMSRESLSSSNCSSSRIAPYVHQSTPSDAFTCAHDKMPTTAPAQTKPLLLDELTKSRLLQLYTTRKPITNPKKIQAHFTCLYLTRSNIDDILRSRLDQTSQHGLRYSSKTSPYSARFADLGKLIQQSWRVTFGTLDFLELIWTGHRPNRNWDSMLTACTGHDDDTDSTATPCPLAANQEEYLALNMAVTYYYSPEGQPTMSLAAIAMTKDAFEAINDHARLRARTQARSQKPNISIPTSLRAGATSFPDLNSDTEFRPVDFDTIPFVHRDLLVPTLCRWRNAEVQSILSMAAEGRAWAARLVRDDQPQNEMDIETEGSWFFPTVKMKEPSPSSAPETASSSCVSSPEPPSEMDCSSNDGHETVDEMPDVQYQHQEQPTYELRAALVPGRDAVFRTIASKLGATMTRNLIRRSSQIPLPIRTGTTSPTGKRRRGA